MDQASVEAADIDECAHILSGVQSHYGATELDMVLLTIEMLVASLKRRERKEVKRFL